MDQDIPLINSHANKSRSCISVAYNMTVLGLLVATTFFSSFTYYSLENDSSDIKDLLHKISDNMMNNTY